MAITPLETLEVIETMENFIAKIRPPESIRKKLDIGYKIDMQSILNLISVILYRFRNS